MSGRRRTLGAGTSLLFCLFCTATVHAADLSDKLVVNGFFTLDGSLSRGGGIALPGANAVVQYRQDKPNFGNSVLGLQADYAATSNLRLTLQGIVGEDSSGRYRPKVKWAYLSYDTGEDLDLRVGQFLPAFLEGTELSSVGYARLWVRPLVPNSGTAGFDSYRGAEFIKRAPLGAYNLTLQGGVGVARHQLREIKNKNFELLSAKLEKNGSWLKLGLFHAASDWTQSVGSASSIREVVSKGSSLEAELLFGPKQINLGYVDVIGGAGPDERMGYLSLAYRLDRWTPYLLFQHQSRSFAAPPPPAGPPPGPPQPAPPPISAAPNGTSTSNAFSLGLRYDLGEHYDVKAQAERIRLSPAGGSEGTTEIYTLLFEGVF